MKGTHETVVGVRALRDNLREYLDMVADGGEVVVTDRGVPIARLGGYDEKFQALVDAGLVRLADPDAALSKVKRVKASGSVSELIERT